MPRSRVTHELKCWPEFFEPTMRGLKRFELRRDDRPESYQVGDELILKEWDPKPGYFSEMGGDGPGQTTNTPKGYTGRTVRVRVDYVLRAEDINKTNAVSRPESFLEHIGACILQPGFVIMSVSLI